jgi:hypothetical protein
VWVRPGHDGVCDEDEDGGADVEIVCGGIEVGRTGFGESAIARSGCEYPRGRSLGGPTFLVDVWRVEVGKGDELEGKLEVEAEQILA